MKLERNALIYSMIDNLIVATLKMCAGMAYSSNSLLSDGLHTMSDFITDIIAFIGSLISKKRANKKHPFGYGNIEYICSLFIGFLLLLLGVYIIIHTINSEILIPPVSILVVLGIAIILKLCSCLYLHHLGKKASSQVLLTSAKESFIDIYSTGGVFVAIVLLQFSDRFPILKYLELLCGVVIGILIIKMAIDLFKNNIIALIGSTDNNEEIINKVKNIIEEIPSIKVNEVELIMVGNYYNANVLISVPKNMSVVKLMRIEKKIKSKIVKKSLKIRYLNVDVEI